MPINLFYELKKYEDISYVDPLMPQAYIVSVVINFPIGLSVYARQF